MIANLFACSIRCLGCPWPADTVGDLSSTQNICVQEACCPTAKDLASRPTSAKCIGHEVKSAVDESANDGRLDFQARRPLFPCDDGSCADCCCRNCICDGAIFSDKTDQRAGRMNGGSFPEDDESSGDFSRWCARVIGSTGRSPNILGKNIRSDVSAVTLVSMAVGRSSPAGRWARIQHQSWLI